MDIKTFRDLIAWLAKAIYRITRKLPEEERFGLTIQMRRSAVSVPSNIAEGYARQTRADYVRYLRVARGSLAELETQLTIAQELDLINQDVGTTKLLQESDRVLQGFRSLTKPKQSPTN